MTDKATNKARTIYAYRVTVQKKNGEIVTIPRIRTESLSIKEAIKKSSDLLSIYGGEIVSVTPESLGKPTDVALNVSKIFFDIKELAAVEAGLMDNVGPLCERRITQAIQLLSIIDEKTAKASRLLQSIYSAD